MANFHRALTILWQAEFGEIPVPQLHPSGALVKKDVLNSLPSYLEVVINHLSKMYAEKSLQDDSDTEELKDIGDALSLLIVVQTATLSIGKEAMLNGKVPKNLKWKNLEEISKSLELRYTVLIDAFQLSPTPIETDPQTMAKLMVDLSRLAQYLEHVESQYGIFTSRFDRPLPQLSTLVHEATAAALSLHVAEMMHMKGLSENASGDHFESLAQSVYDDIEKLLSSEHASSSNPQQEHEFSAYDAAETIISIKDLLMDIYNLNTQNLVMKASEYEELMKEYHAALNSMKKTDNLAKVPKIRENQVVKVSIKTWIDFKIQLEAASESESIIGLPKKHLLQAKRIADSIDPSKYGKVRNASAVMNFLDPLERDYNRLIEAAESELEEEEFSAMITIDDVYQKAYKSKSENHTLMVGEYKVLMRRVHAALSSMYNSADLAKVPENLQGDIVKVPIKTWMDFRIILKAASESTSINGHSKKLLQTAQNKAASIESSVYGSMSNASAEMNYPALLKREYNLMIEVA